MKRWIVLAILFLLPVLATAAEQQVVVFNWSEYMPDAVLAQFEEETGIQVIYSTYDSNEAMYAKVKLMDAGGYDVVFPSTYFVNRMRREGLLAPLDKSRLAHLKHLDPNLLDKPYDPGNTYSLPYLWGTTAIGVNAAMTDASRIRSWRDLWRPEFKGRVMLSDDLRDVFGMALRLLGHSANSTDPLQIEAAYRELADLMPSVRVFESGSPKQPFLNQEVAIGMIWNGEVYMAAKENPDIRYVYPDEGALIWVDNMVVLKNAANIENAHAFIDFLMRPEVAVAISEEIGYASPNAAAVELMDASVRHNPVVYPSGEIIEKGEFQLDVGDAILTYQKYWQKLKSGN
ncbi:MAG: extracellular solute-binding protein [Desulfobacteraceae bacterium]|nr:extracellular solute-binding protein [Desulfobacteraceae bacterium]